MQTYLKGKRGKVRKIKKRDKEIEIKISEKYKIRDRYEEGEMVRMLVMSDSNPYDKCDDNDYSHGYTDGKKIVLY